MSLNTPCRYLKPAFSDHHVRPPAKEAQWQSKGPFTHKSKTWLPPVLLLLRIGLANETIGMQDSLPAATAFATRVIIDHRYANPSDLISSPCLLNGGRGRTLYVCSIICSHDNQRPCIKVFNFQKTQRIICCYFI